MSEISFEMTTAIQAALMASDLCRKVQQELTGEVSFIKNDRSPVTIADYGSQAIICKLISDRFSEDVIVAEEDSRELRKPANARILDQVTRYVNGIIPDSSPAEVCDWIDISSKVPKERFWAVDPIDGTKGFLRGDQYAVALALVEEGVVKLGLLACPNLHVDIGYPDGPRGCLFLAARGKGAVQLDRWGKHKALLSVSQINDPSEAFFTESVEMDHADHELHERVARQVNITKPPLRVDSQVKYGIVARGEAVLYLRIPSPSERTYKEKVWDHAAGTIITEEAGGKVTDAFGKPLDFSCGVKMENNYGIVVSNGTLHDAVLRALRPLPGKPETEN
jgi:3'(2'), 5'-bisphosphate nucleotidase